MRIGVPKEQINNEFRVAITPSGVQHLSERGHPVLIETGAGLGASIPDAAYREAGAQILDNPAEVWANAELICKVKEPTPEEHQYLRPDLMLFAYLHLAADRPCLDALLASKTTAIAYETVTAHDGSLPLLAPMSEVAGRLAVQVGAYHLQSSHRGRGVLLGGVPGVEPAKVVILGGGVAGQQAAAIASGMHADVTVLDISTPVLRMIDARFAGRVRTLVSNTYSVQQAINSADLVIGAVLIPGARTPRLVTSEMLRGMQPGAVLVDIAVDQGGCFEDSRPTTHHEPIFEVDGKVLYCVANMPGAVPVTSTYALTNATLPYLTKLAECGLEALEADAGLAAGLMTRQGELVSEAVAQAHGLA